MKTKLIHIGLGLVLSSPAMAGIVLNGANANIVVESGATLVTDGMKNGGVITNNGVIDNKGDWTNTGTAAVDNLVKFTGTAAQTVYGATDFQTLHLDNAAGASLNSAANITINEVLELKNGTFTTGSGLLTFLSTAVDHCAIIDNFSSGFGGTVSGNVTAQRYHASAVGTFDQHMMGSPVNNGAFSDFIALSGTDGVAVTPTSDCDETQLDPSSNYGTVFQWDESIVTSCHLAGWIVRSAGFMSNGLGYGMAIAGAGTADVTGVPNLNASYTQTNLNNSSWSTSSLQGSTYSSGWHLLSNPYLASFDLNATANADFDNYVQIMNTFGVFAGTYQPLGMSSANLLPPFQAFMVKKTNPGAGTFTFNGSDRSLGVASFQKPAALEGSMEILVQGNSYADITYFQFDPTSTTGFDPQHDAYKLLSSPGKPTIYTTVGTDWLSINTNPDVASTPVIPMGFRPGADGTFTFTAQQMNLPVGVTAVLEDIQLGIFQELNTNPTYTFSSLVSDAPERFNVHFSTVTGIDDLATQDVRTWYNGSEIVILPLNLQEQATLNIFDVAGKLLHSSVVEPNVQKTVNLSNHASGVVVVHVTTSKAAFTQKVVIN